MAKHSLREWIIATRPWSFSASSMSVVCTLAWLWSSSYEVRWLPGVLAVLTLVLMQAASNVWSDIFDYRRGVDAKDTFGSRTIVDGHFTCDEMRQLTAVLETAIVVLGALLIVLTDLTTLYIGLVGLLATLLYPYLKFHALGDLAVLMCYGFLPILGTTYVATGAFVWQALWLFPPVGVLTLAILHANNVRDIATDRRAGIRTFAMLTGARVGVWLYVGEIALPFGWLTGCVVSGIFSWWQLLPMLVLPLAILNVRTILSERHGEWQKSTLLDEKTAQLHLLFCLLLVVSFIAQTFV